MNKKIDDILNPSKNALMLCRKVHKFYKKRNIVVANIVRNHLLHRYGIHLGLEAKLGENLLFPHPNGIVIGDYVRIGDNCTIYHQVTLGRKINISNKQGGYPIVGNNVTIFPGAKIIGNIKIGENSIITANSVVLHNVEPNTIYGGVPAKKLKDI